MQNLSYENEFDLHQNEPVGGTHFLLSRSSLEPLILLDLVNTKLYCFSARVHCYSCLYIIFSVNPVRRSEELLGRPHFRNEWFHTKTRFGKEAKDNSEMAYWKLF